MNTEPAAFTPDMRDIDKNPYSPDEQRVAKYLWELSDGNVGAGDDPIGFLIASHAWFVEERKNARNQSKIVSEIGC